MGRAKNEMIEQQELVGLMQSALTHTEYMNYCEIHDIIYGGDASEIDSDEIEDLRSIPEMEMFEKLSDQEFKELADTAISDSGWNECGLCAKNAAS